MGVFYWSVIVDISFKVGLAHECGKTLSKCISEIQVKYFLVSFLKNRYYILILFIFSDTLFRAVLVLLISVILLLAISYIIFPVLGKDNLHKFFH